MRVGIGPGWRWRRRALSHVHMRGYHAAPDAAAAQRAREQVLELERRWAASPYMHMLATPLRRCVVTHAVMPKDFMIQLKPVLLPAAGDGRGEEQTMLPDAILHPRFAQRKPGKGLWFCADRIVYERLRQRQVHRQVAPEAKISLRLESLITHQLQQRVLQEAELLHERVRTRTLGDTGPNKHAAAVLDMQATAAPGRQMRAGGIPLYHIAAMLGDADLHAALGEWLTRIVERGTQVCTPSAEGVSLAQHPRTSALAVALWRLASWTDSKGPFE